MQHLSSEELARLVDEASGAREAAHLESCASCTAGLEALRRQTTELGGLSDPDPPDRLRRRVEAALAAEGLLSAPRPRLASSRGLRVAAGIALFALGGATGALVVAAAPGSEVGRSVVPPPASAAEAAAALLAAEATYLAALTAYTDLSERGEGVDPINRLAALEGIVLTTSAALREAPADPIINNYHLTAVGQRDALLRRLERISDGNEWY